jgi:hypothetical protein
MEWKLQGCEVGRGKKKEGWGSKLEFELSFAESQTRLMWGIRS